MEPRYLKIERKGATNNTLEWTRAADGPRHSAQRSVSNDEQ